MKGASVKLKLTAWITLLMAALFCLLLVFMLTISSSVAYRTSMDTLIETVKSNLCLLYTSSKRPAPMVFFVLCRILFPCRKPPLPKEARAHLKNCFSERSFSHASLRTSAVLRLL